MQHQQQALRLLDPEKVKKEAGSAEAAANNKRKKRGDGLLLVTVAGGAAGGAHAENVQQQQRPPRWARGASTMQAAPLVCWAEGLKEGGSFFCSAMLGTVQARPTEAATRRAAVCSEHHLAKGAAAVGVEGQDTAREVRHWTQAE